MSWSTRGRGACCCLLINTVWQTSCWSSEGDCLEGISVPSLLPHRNVQKLTDKHKTHTQTNAHSLSLCIEPPQQCSHPSSVLHPWQCPQVPRSQGSNNESVYFANICIQKTSNQYSNTENTQEQIIISSIFFSNVLLKFVIGNWSELFT